MSDEIAFLRAICETPDDDTVRLVYADWLDENGQSERAEFIRLQIAGNLDADAKFRVWEIINGESASWIPLLCWDRNDSTSEWIVESDRVEFSYRRGMPHAVFRRGFLDEIRCTLTEFMDVWCEWCNQTGWVKCLKPAVVGAQVMPRKPCQHCKGTGNLPGLAYLLFATHPITWVTLADKEPDSWPSNLCLWHNDGSGERDDLPIEIFTLLPATRFYNKGDSLAALSDACVRYARSLHGFDPLPVVPRGTNRKRDAIKQKVLNGDAIKK